MSHRRDPEGMQRREITPGKAVKMILLTFLIILAGLVILSSAITRSFGPYEGKVVDAETGHSIEGAAVLMTFFTRRFDESVFSGAMETLTDLNGEFRFPRKRFLGFHIFSIWEPYGYVKIFKPEFGCYVGHKDSNPLFVPNGTLPQNEYVIIKLPKLKTIQERRDNVLDVLPHGVPDKKMRELSNLKQEEEIKIGLKP